MDMDLDTLNAIASEPGPELDAAPELLDAANSKAEEVATLFRPAFAMLSGLGPKYAAFYNEAKVQEASAAFVMLAESEGWDISGVRGKWGIRIAFVMVMTPPHLLEMMISKLMKYATGEAEKKAEPEPEAVAA